VLRIFFEVAFSCINTPLLAFLSVFEAVLKSTLWNAAELFGDGYLNGLNVTTPMAS
jgi:hypothetical protein